MNRSGSSQDSTFQQMVLQDVPPAWLAAQAPEGDVVLSTRARVMRNLKGHLFPHRAPDDELLAIQAQVLKSAKAPKGGLQAIERLSLAEREYLVGCRLVSPDFAWNAPGRSLLLDAKREVSVMVNEEDHLRIQGLCPGWNAEHADELVEGLLGKLEGTLEFAFSPRFGYLAASPYNCGGGVRRSAMFHLIGLAHSKRLPAVLKALAARRLTARGLFGETSRAVGAFLQVSQTDGTEEDFIGACDYLIDEERRARLLVPKPFLRERTQQTLDFLAQSRRISLADALRALAWIRWAAVTDPKGLPARTVDLWLAHLGIEDSKDDAGVVRARYLQGRLGL